MECRRPGVRLSVLDRRQLDFPRPILKRAFEPYVTTKAKGTGLGLAVVKKIADEHWLVRMRPRQTAGGRTDKLVVGAQVSLSLCNSCIGPRLDPSHR